MVKKKSFCFEKWLCLDGWANARHDVAANRSGILVQESSFDDDILDAAHVVGGGADPGHASAADPRVTSDKEAVVGVGRTDTRSSDARLGEDVVDGQGHHVLGLDS